MNSVEWNSVTETEFAATVEAEAAACSSIEAEEQPVAELRAGKELCSQAEQAALAETCDTEACIAALVQLVDVEQEPAEPETCTWVAEAPNHIEPEACTEILVPAIDTAVRWAEQQPAEAVAEMECESAVLQPVVVAVIA